MKKIINYISTRILKYRGITHEYFDMRGIKCTKIECITCGQEFKPTKENVQAYMFGHINCPKVYVIPFIGIKRNYIR